MVSPAAPKPSTRDRIIEAALDLFASEGYGGTTVTEIERRVGLAAGTGSFYRHFRSKDDLLQVAVDQEVRRCMEEITEGRLRRDSGGDPTEERAAHITLALEDIRHFDRLFRIAIRDAERVPAVRAAIGVAMRRLSDQLGLGRHPTTTVLVTALAGYHLLELLFGESLLEVSEADLVAALVEVTEPAPPR